MGQPRTETIGGGGATPVANNWNHWLGSQLYSSAPGASSINQASNQFGNVGGMSQQHAQYMQQLMQNAPRGMNPQQHAQYMQQGYNQFQQEQSRSGGPGPFQNLVNQAMNPNIGNMIQQNPFLSGLQGHNPSAQLPNAPQWEGIAGINNAPPQWQNTQFQNPERISAGRSIASQIDPTQAATIDPMQFLGNFSSGREMLNQFGINPGQMGMPGASADFSFTKGKLADYTQDPNFQAIQDIANRQKQLDTANIRARYGAIGNTDTSGASLAEGQYAAEANPRLIAALGGLGREIQGLDLNQQGINNQMQLGMTNAQVQDALGRGQIGANQMSNMLGYIQGTRGQDMGAAAGLAGQNLSNQQSAYNQTAGNRLNALVSDASNRLRAGEGNASNTMGLNQLNLQQGMGQNQFNQGNWQTQFGGNMQEMLARNQFNQNNFGQQSSNALNNQGMANNWQSMLGQLGINLQGMSQQQQQNIMNQLFNSFNQTNQLGTPQAQTVQVPSQGAQMFNTGANLLQMYAGMQNPLAAAAMMSGRGGIGNPMQPSGGAGIQGSPYLPTSNYNMGGVGGGGGGYTSGMPYQPMGGIQNPMFGGGTPGTAQMMGGIGNGGGFMPPQGMAGVMGGQYQYNNYNPNERYSVG